jgi:hypothetical protein
MSLKYLNEFVELENEMIKVLDSAEREYNDKKSVSKKRKQPKTYSSAPMNKKLKMDTESTKTSTIPKKRNQPKPNSEAPINKKIKLEGKSTETSTIQKIIKNVSELSIKKM